MAELTATGDRALQMLALRDMISKSSTLQDDVGATGETADKIATAKEYIILLDADQPYTYPMVLITLPPNDKEERITTNTFNSSGDFEVSISREIPDAYSGTTYEEKSNSAIDFMNFYEGVKTDVKLLVATGGSLLINSISVIEGPGLVENPNDINTYNYGIRLLVGFSF